MLGVMGLSAIFAKIAGRGGRKLPVVKFTSSEDDPFIQSLSCNGAITIESTKDGEVVKETYYNLKNTLVEIQADADTEVMISGYVTDLNFTVYNDDPDVDDYEGCFDISTVDVSGCLGLKSLNVSYCENITELNLAANTALQYLDCGNTSIAELNLAANTALQTLNCYGCTSITELNLAANTALQYLDCNGCTSIAELNLAANTALQYLDCSGCTSITELNLAANTALQYLDCSGCTSLNSINYPATNEDVSTAIASAITNADAADGKVYTDSTAAYYSTIADAATAKGWTINQL